jgi:hypothetical protein
MPLRPVKKLFIFLAGIKADNLPFSITARYSGLYAYASWSTLAQAEE